LEGSLVSQVRAVGLNPSAGEPAAVCPPSRALCMQVANRAESASDLLLCCRWRHSDASL